MPPNHAANCVGLIMTIVAIIFIALYLSKVDDFNECDGNLTTSVAAFSECQSEKHCYWYVYHIHFVGDTAVISSSKPIAEGVCYMRHKSNKPHSYKYVCETENGMPMRHTWLESSGKKWENCPSSVKPDVAPPSEWESNPHDWTCHQICI